MTGIFESYYIRGEKISHKWLTGDEKAMWSAPLVDMLRAYNEGRKITLFDPVQKHLCRLDIEELHEYLDNVDKDRIDDEPYLRFYIPDKGEEWDIDVYNSYLLGKIHHSWYNLLRVLLNDTAFKRLLGAIKERRKLTEVFPDTHQIFNVFSTDFYDIKVVWLGLSPYPNKQKTSNNANGWAFATYNYYKPDSLKILQEAIRKNFGHGFKWELKNDLSHLIRQGVFLLNAALTTEADATSHLEHWKPFISEVIKILATQEHIGFVFFGAWAKSFRPLVPDTRTMWSINHPAWFARQEQTMVTTMFSEQSKLYDITF